MPAISVLRRERAGVRSSESSATIEAFAESPTNRMPSGPKASGPADLSSALPGVRVELAPNARAVVRDNATAVLKNMLGIFTEFTFWPPELKVGLILSHCGWPGLIP